ncbi:MAG TPA: hypothetical protein PLF15_00760 [bacterium]|nr:hypothetical protein [bacterium]
MKKPRLKKIKTIGKITVWIVDGSYIRQHFNIEFSNFGQHYHYRFIPTNEFWLDKTEVLGEEKFFINHLLLEHKLMAEGKKYDWAFNQADKMEHLERLQSLGIKKKLKNKHKKRELMKLIHQKLWTKYSDDQIKIWIVDGRLVRDFLLTYFTAGGHGFVYNFIPKNEIWIDNVLNEKEKKLTLIHELRERNLMANGWGYDINTLFNIRHKDKIKKGAQAAHVSARYLESYCRHHPQELENKIKLELKNNLKHPALKI